MLSPCRGVKCSFVANIFSGDLSSDRYRDHVLFVVRGWLYMLYLAMDNP